jgi:hypothetical protein
VLIKNIKKGSKMNKNLMLVVALSSSMSINALAKNKNDGNWIENYLDKNNGSELSQFTDYENNSRWYYNLRLHALSAVGSSTDNHSNQLEASLRLRGKTMFTDDLGFTADLWIKAQENYNTLDGETVNEYDDLDEDATWENFIVGVESNKYGALVYAKHTANWSVFATDIGMHGANNIQGEAGGKNAGKIIYKNHFDNNLFIHTSYDLNSKIIGLDLGYQTDNIYPFRADSYGVYFSVHNGQPFLNSGFNSSIIGNVDTDSKTKSDTDYNRHSDDLLTYSLSGYKQFGVKGRAGAVVAYSDREDDVSKDVIRERGYTEGGLGLSVSVSYQYLPDGFTGWAPGVTASHDEFNDKFIPLVQYFITPQIRVWGGHVFVSNGANSTQIEFQADF